jgi:hypothetical protein
MKEVGSDGTYIDYWQSVGTVQRGLKNQFGVRVREDHCLVVVKIGEEEPTTFGKIHEMPVNLELLPIHIRMIIADHIIHYPQSDLTDVLTSKKSFEDALCSPIRIPLAAKLKPKKLSSTS